MNNTSPQPPSDQIIRAGSPKREGAISRWHLAISFLIIFNFSFSIFNYVNAQIKSSFQVDSLNIKRMQSSLSKGASTDSLLTDSSGYIRKVAVSRLKDSIVKYAGSVSSFNTRTGDVALTSGDVTTALGYTPLSNATNYLPLTGGDLTRSLATSPDVDGGALLNLRNPSNPGDSRILGFGQLGNDVYIRFMSQAVGNNLLFLGSGGATAATLTGGGNLNTTGNLSAATITIRNGLNTFTNNVLTVDASGNVSTLGYLPSRDSTLQGSSTITINKSGLTRTLSLTSTNVTNALGYTPLSNATNYLPLTGGSISGMLNVNPSLGSSPASADDGQAFTIGNASVGGRMLMFGQIGTNQYIRSLGSLLFLNASAITRATLDQNGNFTVPGNVTASTACASGFTCLSDLRYKQNITTIPNALDVVKQIRGTSYNFRTQEFKEKNFDDKKHFGFIAQELEQVIPNVVSTQEDGYKTVNYQEVIPILIEAVKEQQVMIEELKRSMK